MNGIFAVLVGIFVMLVFIDRIATKCLRELRRLREIAEDDGGVRIDAPKFKIDIVHPHDERAGK